MHQTAFLFLCAPRFWWVSPRLRPSEHRREPESSPYNWATALMAGFCKAAC